MHAHTQLGDPTVYGNIPPCPAIISAITRSLQSSSSYGYVNACGTLEARNAIAKHHSSHEHWSRMHGVATDDGRREQNIEVIPPLTSDDVIVANGVSGALELALTALLDEDSVLLGAYFYILSQSLSCLVICWALTTPSPFSRMDSSTSWLSIVPSHCRESWRIGGTLQFTTR